MTVLLIDDDDDLRAAIADTFAIAGIAVESHADARAAQRAGVERVREVRARVPARRARRASGLVRPPAAVDFGFRIGILRALPTRHRASLDEAGRGGTGSTWWA